MIRPSRVKAKLRRGEPALVTALHFADPAVYEMTSLMGFDGLWLDLEHHGLSLESASQLMRAARVGASDVIARPAKGEFMRTCRLLEIGAQGIMYPRCDSADEAAELVRWAKFAPEGERGVDGANADAPYCFAPMHQYLKAANDGTLLVVQIESPAALENVEAIARVPGVDVLMFGPGDFSVLAGIPYQFDHPMIADARRRIAAAARAGGKWWGTVGFSPEHSKTLLDEGARFVCHGADIVILKAGLERIRREFAPLGFAFDDRTRPRPEPKP